MASTFTAHFAVAQHYVGPGKGNKKYEKAHVVVSNCLRCYSALKVIVTKALSIQS